jgi:hypothetical protein
MPVVHTTFYISLHLNLWTFKKFLNIELDFAKFPSLRCLVSMTICLFYCLWNKTVTVSLRMDEIIPKTILERADKANENLLSRKSRLQYDKEYHNFEKWMLKNDLKVTKVSETVLMGYFEELVCILYIFNNFWQSVSFIVGVIQPKFTLVEIFNAKIDIVSLQENRYKKL